MNRGLLLISACILQIAAFCQGTDREKAGLKGEVKSIKLFTTGIKADGSPIVQNAVLNSYDEKGQSTSIAIYKGGTNEQTSEESYQYSDGQLLWKNLKRIDGTEAKKIFTYNNKKQLILEETVPAENSSMRLLRPVIKKYYTYDDAGNLTEEKTVSNGGELTFRNSYNKSNQKVKVEVWNNGSLGSIVEFFYGRNKQVIKEVRKNALGKIYAETTYKYDQGGNKVESQTKEFDGGKTYISRQTWKYDGNNNEVENVDNSDGQVTTFSSKYDFDLQGNWITKTVYRNGVPWMEQRREIIYN